jgi:hypothetical protein
MIFFKPYSNIQDFLYRFTILKIGKLHIRIHKITDKDQTDLYHNHPFHYLSIILWGGYTESRLKDFTEVLNSYGFLSFIFRKSSSFHKILSIKKQTYTLFFAYGSYGWEAFNPNLIEIDEPKIYQRSINGKIKWCKKHKGVWFIGHESKEEAEKEIRYSIYQAIKEI